MAVRHGKFLLSALAACALLPVLPAAEASAKVVRPKAFTSCGDWVRYARSHAVDVVRPYGLPDTPGAPLVAPAPAPPDSGGGGGGSGGGGGEGGGGGGRSDSLTTAPVAGEDFSGTNVQEEGVDEPDHVKTDGRMIYVAGDDHLRSADVSAGAPRAVDTLKLDGYDHQLLLRGDKLLVVSGPGDEAAEGVGTIIREVDVSNPAAMRVTRIMQVEGRYVGGRLTDSTARIVIATDPDIDVPPWPEGEQYIPEEAQRRAERVVKRARIGKWRPAYKLVNRRTGKKSWRALVPCKSVRRPAEFAGVGTLTVLTIDLDRGLPAVDSDALFANADTVYASRAGLYLATERWDESDDPATGSATTIHKFAAPPAPQTAYRATGLVDGFLLSQWSLSEHEGVLRVATTSEPPWTEEDDGRERDSQSSVDVLEEDGAVLEQVGSVGGLGRGEEIFAVRFIGTTGYVVTFRQTDPLYTVDVSDKTRPRVVGELKIPGYSAYLHPVGEGLLLGVGQDADARGRIRGTQLSLFDVSDPRHPRQIHKLTLTEDSSSEVEWDHRGFLWWPATKTAVIPVEAYSDGADFLGALAYRVDAETGIQEVGRIEHTDDYESGWLTRALVVGPNLYTVSDVGLGANELSGFGPVGFLPFSPSEG